MSKKNRTKKKKKTKVQWTATLKDEIKVKIHYIDTKNEKEIVNLAMEVGKQKIKGIINRRGKKMKVDTARLILSTTRDSIINRIAKKEIEVILVKKDNELIGFTINHGVLEEVKLIEELSIDSTKEMTREGVRILIESGTLKYKRKGLNRCLVLLTLFTRPEKIIYTPITSEYATGLVEMYKDIANKCNMGIKIEEDKGQYGIDLIKNENSETLLKQILIEDYKLKGLRK